MMSKTILTDVDGVLLNWHGLFAQWMSERGYVQDPAVKSYDLGERYRMPKEWIQAEAARFNTSAAVGFCAAERDSAHYVERLGNRGYKFVAITAMGGDKYSRELRIRNLRDIFGDVFLDFIFTDLNASKDAILKQYEGGEHWWIEDKLSNAEAGLQFGLRPILIRHDHNAHCDSDDILCVDNWKQIFAIITGEEYV